VDGRVCEWSTSTDLTRIKNKWKLQRDEIIATLPSYQQGLIEDAKLKLLIDDRLATLKSIKVYVAKSGVGFEIIRLYYKDLAEEPDKKLDRLEDLVNVADNRDINDRPKKLELALAKIPPGYFYTPADRTRLETYINDAKTHPEKLKGLIGTAPGPGPQESCNISIQPIYVDPEFYQVRDETTDGRKAWVIFSNYSGVFAPPPLQP